MRTKARETVFEVIFASRFSEGKTDGNLKKALYKNANLGEADIAYADAVISFVENNQDELVKVVDGYSRSFPESRLYPADISILLIALVEIKYMNDIPAAVSINEAANIASKYSSAKSASFISGILAAVVNR